MRYLFTRVKDNKGYNRSRLVTNIVSNVTGLRGELLSVESNFHELSDLIASSKLNLQKNKSEIESLKASLVHRPQRQLEFVNDKMNRTPVRDADPSSSTEYTNQSALKQLSKTGRSEFHSSGELEDEIIVKDNCSIM